MAPNRGRVHGDLVAQARDQRLELVGEVRERGLHQVGVVGETPDEPVEGPTVGQGAEAAERAETRFVLQPANQRVGMGRFRMKEPT